MAITSPLSFYNTLSRQTDVFTPLRPGIVSLYSCGPTVYSRQHIGNMRAALFVDTLKRTLRFNCYEVQDVVNITDVGHLVSDEDEGEDKMEKAAREQGKNPYEIARHFEMLYWKDVEDMNIIMPRYKPRATDHIPEQIEFIREIEEHGFTYVTDDGVYFDTKKLPVYGILSRQTADDRREGARVAPRGGKRHPADFALWKFLTGDNRNHVMQWESPWGVGFPGWHIECSAMSHRYLGSEFDIHTGGIEHIPIHHENEIAQNVGSGKITRISFWIHNEHLLLRGGKMAKSLGNVITLDDIRESGIHPLAFRYLALTAHYRSPLNFTWESLRSAEKALTHFRRAFNLSSGRVPPGTSPDARYIDRFRDFVNNDLDTPRALALAWELAKDGNIPRDAQCATLASFDTVFGLRLCEKVNGLDARDTMRTPLALDELPSDVQVKIEKREHARHEKRWADADRLRDEIEALGFFIEDSENGPSITKR